MKRLCYVFATLLLAGPAYAQDDLKPARPRMADNGGQAMMAGMEKMHQDMAAVPMNGSADQIFAAMMVPHHQGAISMAQAELRHGKDVTLRQLARNIISAQQQEIAQMRRWQKAHPAQQAASFCFSRGGRTSRCKEPPSSSDAGDFADVVLTGARTTASLKQEPFMRINKLGRTGLFVSELCLGAMTFGGGQGMWQQIGALDQADSERLIGRDRRRHQLH